MNEDPQGNHFVQPKEESSHVWQNMQSYCLLPFVYGLSVAIGVGVGREIFFFFSKRLR